MRRRLMLALALLVGLVSSSGDVARASCARPDSPGVIDYESITVSSVSIGFTAAKISPATGQVFAALVTLETNPIRWRADGTAPTASEGHLVAASSQIEVCGTQNVLNFRMIRTGSDATAKVSYFR